MLHNNSPQFWGVLSHVSAVILRPDMYLSLKSHVIGASDPPLLASMPPGTAFYMLYIYQYVRKAIPQLSLFLTPSPSTRVRHLWSHAVRRCTTSSFHTTISAHAAIGASIPEAQALI